MARTFPPAARPGPLADLLRPDPADGHLLESFVRDHDQEAFAAVVRRHGPLVLGVCRRVLRNPADADDAFQAAFLVLARRAATLGPGVRLANWLFGVAFNTARRLRRTNLRRANRETPLAAVPEPHTTVVPEPHAELLAVLDEELARLPEKYRAPIVLCDLGGATRKEAARALGCPEGTVAGRLARARSRLAAQLAGRGVGPTSCAALVAILAAERTTAVVFPRLLTRAVTAGAIPPRVAAISEGVIRAMFLHKLRTAAGVLLVAALGFVAVAGLTGETVTAQPNDQPPPAKAIPPAEAKAAEPAKKAEPDRKILTVFPLKKLDPEATAKTLVELVNGPAGPGALNVNPGTERAKIVPLPAEKAILVYADELATKTVETALRMLGEGRTVSTVVPLRKLDPDKAAQLVKDKMGRGAPPVFAVPADKVLLLYADGETTAKVLDVLREAGEDVPKLGVPLPTAAVKEPTFALELRETPWADILKWYSEITGLTYVGDVKLAGKVTVLGKGRTYTLAEITDILNESLLQQRFILVRRNATFTVVPADEKLDLTFVPDVRVDDMEKRGKTELVSVVMPLTDLKAKDVAPEIRKLLTPFGEVVVLESSNSLVVRDTAGNARRIWLTLHQVKSNDPPVQPANPPVVGVKEVRYEISFRNVPWADVLDWYAKISGLFLNTAVKPTGTVTITPEKGKTFTVREITDLLNEALIDQKFLLIRRLASFTLVPADEKIDPTLVPHVRIEDLDAQAQTDLIIVSIPTGILMAKDAATEVRKLLGPFGSVAVSETTNSVIVTDLAQNVRRVWRALGSPAGRKD